MEETIFPDVFAITSPRVYGRRFKVEKWKKPEKGRRKKTVGGEEVRKVEVNEFEQAELDDTMEGWTKETEGKHKGSEDERSRGWKGMKGSGRGGGSSVLN